MMKRVAAVLAAVILSGSPLLAQQIDSGSISANSSGGGCTGTALSCTSFLPGTASSITLQVTGTFVGTLTFEASSDANQTNWFTVSGTNLADGSTASTTTTTGQFAFNNSGLTGLRARATAWTSGTATVTAARGYAIARWLTPFFSSIKVADGTSGAPSIAFASQPGLGFWRSSVGVITLQGGLTTTAVLNASEVFVVSTGRIGSGTLGTVAFPFDGLLKVQNNAGAIGSVLKVDALPTVASGFGTSPSVTAGSTPLAGSVNVGTGGVATSGVINLNGTAFPSAPFVTCMNTTTAAVLKCASSTTQLTITGAAAFTASDVVVWQAISPK